MSVELNYLPEHVLEKIFSYMTFDDVSRCRLVCRQFNDLGMAALNDGFYRVQKYHSQYLQRIQSTLPCEVLERVKHPLSRHFDILVAVETCLSLLEMTFLKYIHFKFCCFIPGKVLDEIYRLLQYVSTEKEPARAHEVLKELRHLTSMAMEHFDDKISPAFKTQTIAGFTYIPEDFSKRSSQNRFKKVKRKIRHTSLKWAYKNKGAIFLHLQLSELNNKQTELEKSLDDQQTLVKPQIKKEQDLKLDDISQQVSKGENTPICDSLYSKKRSIMESFYSQHKKRQSAKANRYKMLMKKTEQPLDDQQQLMKSQVKTEKEQDIILDIISEQDRKDETFFTPICNSLDSNELLSTNSNSGKILIKERKPRSSMKFQIKGKTTGS